MIYTENSHTQTKNVQVNLGIFKATNVTEKWLKGTVHTVDSEIMRKKIHHHPEILNAELHISGTFYTAKNSNKE
jgi:hypothetical protein